MRAVRRCFSATVLSALMLLSSGETRLALFRLALRGPSLHFRSPHILPALVDRVERRPNLFSSFLRCFSATVCAGQAEFQVLSALRLFVRLRFFAQRGFFCFFFFWNIPSAKPPLCSGFPSKALSRFFFSCHES